jgi:integrase/recombinase XerD
MNIEIKERPLKNGNRSLYLEYYEPGFRRRERLGLYLVPDDAPKAKSLNRQTWNKAREIRSERILNPPTFEQKEEEPETIEDHRKETMTWLGWCDEYIEWSEGCGNCKKMMQHKNVVRKRIAAYLKRTKQTDILLKDVGKDEVAGLFDYMRKTYRNRKQIKTGGGKLADYTLLLFEETVKAIFNKALREQLIAFNPVHSLNRLQRFHAPDKHREHLTAEELTRFLAVETASENERTVQLAFGLSSMTGLRLGDMQRLTWGDIQTIDGIPTICIIQHKTKRPVSIPLNDLAQSLLPERGEAKDDDLVFHLVKKSDNVCMYVRRIKDKAGIEKDLTYHCSRHTSATLAITAGADISVVKEVLGHGSIKSTEVYAKVALEKKIEAVNLFNGVFD